MRTHLGGLLVAGLLAAGGSSYAQTTPPAPAPCTAAPQPVPCSAPAAKPTAEQFPFPGETAPTAAATPSAAKPDAPDAPGADAAKRKTATDFPFPGETPKAAADSSSSSSSSSSNDDPIPDPDASGLKDKGSEGSQAPQGRHLLHRVNPIGTKLLTDEEREAEDLDVAHFYTDSGDLKGAYLRVQDAVKIAPNDPDAHCALAGAALKMNKRDEAIAEYNACLKLDPDAKEAKAARKELLRLKP